MRPRKAYRSTLEGSQRLIHGMLKEQSGATALEFALVATPLMFLVFAILEIALMFTLGVNLSNATANVARELRVGELIAPGTAAVTSSGNQLDLADFKTAVCSQIALVPKANCISALQVDVRTLSSYQATPPTSPLVASTFNTTSMCYYSGAAGSVVEMRSYYLWPVFTPLLLSMLINTKTVISSSGATSGNWSLLSSTIVFKNEPSAALTNTGAGC